MWQQTWSFVSCRVQSSHPVIFIRISVIGLCDHPAASSTYQTAFQMFFFLFLIYSPLFFLNSVMINQSCHFPVLFSVQCGGYLGE